MRPQTVAVSEPLHAAAGPWIARAIADCIAARGRCRLALSGGSTPGGTLRWLAENLPVAHHRHLDVTLVDERAVPPGHADATFRLVGEALLRHLPGASAHPMFLGGGLRDECARFSRVFAGALGGGVDVVVLGVGGDGHIGSLFPGHPALAAGGVCAAVEDSPKPPPERLTLTMPVLEAAGWVVLLARGAGKADVLGRAWAGDTTLPVGQLAPAGRYHWVLDAAASSALPAEALEDR